MTASYKIALAAGGLLLLIVISSLILRSEPAGDGDPTDPANDDLLALDDGADASAQTPIRPLPDPDADPLGPPRRDTGDDPASRTNFLDRDPIDTLPEPEENGYPTLDVGRQPFESDNRLFGGDVVPMGTGVINVPEPERIDPDTSDIAAALDAQTPDRPSVAIGPTDRVGPPTTVSIDDAEGRTPTPPAEPPLLRLYTIESGDSLSSVALETYGSATKWVEIAQANPLVDPNRLKVGQEIKLPDLDGVGPDVAVTADGDAEAAPDDDLPRRGATYVIKAGDSLSTIAKQFYGSASKWELIYQANRRTIGGDPGKLKLGAELLIPPPDTGAN